jgi:predicted ATP-dependent endonuclease of OLD family
MSCFIKSLEISNYRSFTAKQTVNFAIPKCNLPGSGMTIIVGPNNSGKTSFIEAISITKNSRVGQNERYSNKAILIKKSLQSGVSAQFYNVSQGSLIECGVKPLDGKFEFSPLVIGSIKSITRNLSSHEMEAQEFTRNSAGSYVRGAINHNIGGRLKAIIKADREEFSSYVQKILPQFHDWTIDTDDNGQDYIVYHSSYGSAHRIDLTGDGVLAVITICANLFNNPELKTLIIDEPEKSLHPNAQKRLFKMLLHESKDKQIVICTHSPHFISFQSFINGGEIIRFNKLNDKNTTVHKLDRNNPYKDLLMKQIEEWQKPQLFDSVAKEIFFSENILFCEGPEDVGIISRYLESENIEYSFDIYGYGVGGVNNMPLYVRLSQDLCVQKTAFLFDGDEGALKIKKELESKKSNGNVLFVNLSKCDIRDKTDKPKSIDGVFDSSGNIKPGNKIEFDQLLMQILSHLEVKK